MIGYFSVSWLTGRGFYAARNFTLEDVHVEGTERIAEAVAKYDVDRYIHMSSYNADPESPSEFFSTKVWQPDMRVCAEKPGRGPP